MINVNDWLDEADAVIELSKRNWKQIENLWALTSSSFLWPSTFKGGCGRDSFGFIPCLKRPPTNHPAWDIPEGNFAELLFITSNDVKPNPTVQPDVTTPRQKESAPAAFTWCNASVELTFSCKCTPKKTIPQVIIWPWQLSTNRAYGLQT